MRFVAPDIAWAVRITDQGAMEILRTTDQMKTWRKCAPNGDWAGASADTVTYAKKHRRHDSLMLDLYAADGNTAWIVIGATHNYRREAYVVGTRDGGDHWTGSWVAMANDIEVLNLQFVDAKNGFIYEHLRPAANQLLRRIYRTQDAGNTWSEMALPDERRFPDVEWEACTFRTALDGWLVTLENLHGEPTTYCTHDAGKSWQAESLHLPAKLEGGRSEVKLPQFFGKEKRDGVLGVSYLTDKDDLMLFYQTHDGGGHWTPAGKPPIHVWGRSKDYSFLDDGTGWMVVENDIVKTDDYGKTWTKLPTAVPLWVTDLESDGFQLCFVNHRVGWIFVPWFKNKLLQTQDAGKSWGQLFPSFRK